MNLQKTSRRGSGTGPLNRNPSVLKGYEPMILAHRKRTWLVGAVGIVLLVATVLLGLKAWRLAVEPGDASKGSRAAEELVPLTEVFCTADSTASEEMTQIARQAGLSKRQISDIQGIVRKAYADMLVAAPPVFGISSDTVDYTVAFHLVEDMNSAIRHRLGWRYPRFKAAFNEVYGRRLANR